MLSKRISVIDRTPKGETLRKYFPSSCLTNDELYGLAKWYAKTNGIMFVKPSMNRGFGVLVGFAGENKEWKLKLIKNIEKHGETQCWEDHDCLMEIIKEIENGKDKT